MPSQLRMSLHCLNELGICINGTNYNNTLFPHAVSSCGVLPQKHTSQFENLCCWLSNIYKSQEDAEPPLGCCKSAGRGTGADWGKQNAKSIHVCNGYTEVIVQRDPLPSPLPLPPPPHHSIN